MDVHFVGVDFALPRRASRYDALPLVEDFVYEQLAEFGCLPRGDVVQKFIDQTFETSRRTRRVRIMVCLTDEEAIATAGDRSEYKHADVEEVSQETRRGLKKICTKRESRKRKRDEPKCESKGSDPVCPICLDEIGTRRRVDLKCKHTFHYSCLKKWLGVKMTCPTCQSAVSF